MKDYYIHADTIEEMKSVLSPFGLVKDNEFVLATHLYALDYLGYVISVPAEYNEEGEEQNPAIFYPGVYVALRVMDDSFADQVEVSNLNLVSKPQGARSWAS